MVLYFGGNQIYEKEARWRHGNALAQLLSAEEIIKVMFSNFLHDLFFLRDLPSTKGWVESDFKSPRYRAQVKEIFYNFARVYKQYYQIRIINSSGREILGIDNREDGTTLILPQTDLQERKDQYYFQETLKLKIDQIYASPIELETYLPLIRLATPLFNSQNEKKGILVLNIPFSQVLRGLPRNVFVQTEEGDLISLKSDGSLKFDKSNYDFTGPSGSLYISSIETIHYSTLEFLPGRKLIVAIHDTHPLLKVALQRLSLGSTILLALFLFLILIIGYLNISRFRELIRAQKAIIFSLAGLAERRDPETGHHLERTRNYSVILARGLCKNKKYRKIITDEFIENLYDAAPLHDIGKVGIRDYILLKKSNLTREEGEEMKKHVQIGKEIVQDVIDRFKLKQPFFLMARNICGYHHEKYNGRGYPEGLRGEEIPLEARIFALSDAYDAIRAKRPYKAPLSHEEAVRRIKTERREHFDPDIVDAFLECKEEFLKIGETYRY